MTAPKRKLSQVHKDWWEGLENRATHPNVNFWPQFKARLTITSVLVLFACGLFVLGCLALPIITAVWFVGGLPFLLYTQSFPIRNFWRDRKKSKFPPVVR